MQSISFIFVDAEGMVCSGLSTHLIRLQVDATWYGHVHSYSRTCPVFQRNCMGFAADGTANAPVHLLIGHAGAFKRKLLACSEVCIL